MKKEIIWSQDASDDLYDIIEYLKNKYGNAKATEVFEKIVQRVEAIEEFSESGRFIPELLNIGIRDLKELIETPWRVIYRTTNTQIQVISVIDGRRNVEEILYKKVIDGKIG